MLIECGVRALRDRLVSRGDLMYTGGAGRTEDGHSYYVRKTQRIPTRRAYSWVQAENNSSILRRSSTTVYFYIRNHVCKFYTGKLVLLIELFLRELAVVFPVKKH